MLNSIKTYFVNLYQKFWDWQHNVATILLARLTLLAGFVTSALSFVDWSPLYNLVGMDTGFTKTQVFWLGAMTATKGFFDEIVRRANTTVVDNKLVPTDKGN